jgi:hypothetical protein
MKDGRGSLMASFHRSVARRGKPQEEGAEDGGHTAQLLDRVRTILPAARVERGEWVHGCIVEAFLPEMQVHPRVRRCDATSEVLERQSW